MPLYDIDSYLIEEISYKEILKLLTGQKSSIGTKKSKNTTDEDMKKIE